MMAAVNFTKGNHCMDLYSKWSVLAVWVQANFLALVSNAVSGKHQVRIIPTFLSAVIEGARKLCIVDEG